MSSGTYHHGDLRTALVQAGLMLLATREADDLSLREVARAVNVSATAVYRHFPDKRALMESLAAEGLERLAEAQHIASQAAGGGAAGFDATGRAYVNFAIENPALFRLIFASGSEGRRRSTRPAAPSEAMRFLRSSAAAIAPAGVDPDVLALGAWSIAHGLAMLILDGQVDADPALIDAVITSVERPRSRPAAERSPARRGHLRRRG